jgi:hypothetical protein
LDKVLCKWLTAKFSEGKPMIVPMIMEEAKCFCPEIKVTDRFTFFLGWLQNFEELAARGGIQMNYSSD